ncbi:Pyridoxine/pyridoxamine 5'-phosphate oxidase [Loktanella fryxellensis]|uniref:Pyridoxine/pyridoxamine 5'-phosphate oxidase n=1 Tax=Loktanella fryxellensis TaxID=245187 RepID=A0A1H8J4J7_9RHOB|nr:pyridoxamine 5'-phosphate oxidase family protein [Loktanella fryxellensis]SEN74898.1 Pyridoxine/pyridoxamine 5'-phosphate oxidase [Loktanella fryxellensis]
MSDWFTTLDGLHAQVWQRLGRGVADRRSPSRQPTLATVSPDDWPEARTVVLRRAVPTDAVVEVYTDTQSDKIASLTATPRAALHVWEATQHLQIRLLADVTLLQGDDVSDRWATLPEVGRLSYGITPAPGQPIADALSYAKTPDPRRFCVLRLTVQHIDVVHLGDDHRRAGFDRADGWAGRWLSP